MAHFKATWEVPLRNASRILLFLLSVLFLLTSVTAQTPVGTLFTYQGRLSDGGNAATGIYDFSLRLFDGPVAGNQVGSTITRNDVAVTGGVFSVSLDFGAVFGSSARWLEVGVRPGASTGAYTTLSPVQQLTATPNALHAANAATIAGLACVNGQVAKWSGTSWICGSDANDGGTVTSIATGAGLTGGPITAAGTLSVATGGITAAMIANSAITGAHLVNGTITGTQLAADIAISSGLTVGTITYSAAQSRRWSINGTACRGANLSITGAHECLTSAPGTSMYFPVSGIPDGAVLTSMQYIGNIGSGASISCLLSYGQFGAGTNVTFSVINGTGVWAFSSAASLSHTIDQNQNSYGIRCFQFIGAATTFGISFIKLDYTMTRPQ